MQKLALLLIGLFFGAGAGFLVAASWGVTLDGHDHAQHLAPGDTAETGAHHKHGTFIDLPAGATAPTLAIALHPDATSGYNLHITTQNFRFAPEAVNGASAPGEGVPIYRPDGVRIADDYHALWTTRTAGVTYPLRAAATVTSSGQVGSANRWVWTGSNHSGTNSGSRQLGDANPSLSRCAHPRR